MTPILRLRITTGTATPADAQSVLAERDRLEAENERLARKCNRMVRSAALEDIEDPRRPQPWSNRP